MLLPPAPLPRSKIPTVNQWSDNGQSMVNHWSINAGRVVAAAEAAGAPEKRVFWGERCPLQQPWAWARCSPHTSLRSIPCCARPGKRSAANCCATAGSAICHHPARAGGARAARRCCGTCAVAKKKVAVTPRPSTFSCSMAQAMKSKTWLTSRLMPTSGRSSVPGCPALGQPGVLRRFIWPLWPWGFLLL